ncbi:MAG: TenA family protein [Tatlockia sp.]|jgi:thiaminase/transcriptional activator TenA
MIFNRMLDAVTPLLPRIYTHSFNKGLYHGTLSIDRFHNFLRQDRIYLLENAKALRATASRIENATQQQVLLSLAETIKQEDALHRKYLLCGNPHTFFASPVTLLPEVQNYIDFLHEGAKHSHVSSAVARFIPCFYLYRELGMNMSDVGITNPYFLWIKSYSSEKFINSGDALIALGNALAHSASRDEKDKMVDAFVQSTQFELSFWDAICPEEEQMDLTAQVMR